MFSGQEKQNGSVGVEFAITMPLFLLIVFVVLEISFCWVDRYFLRLGTFEAVRVVTLIDDFSECAEEQCQCSDEALEKAEYRLALRLALSASAVNSKLKTMLFAGEPVPFDLAANSSDRLADLASFAKFVGGIPTALLLSNIKECYFDSKENAVMMTTSYHRPVKIPLGGRFLAGSMSSLMQMTGKKDAKKIVGLTKPISDIIMEYKSSFMTMNMAQRLKIPEFVNHKETKWKKGSAFGVAPFFDDEHAENWRNWALKMQEMPVQ